MPTMTKLYLKLDISLNTMSDKVRQVFNIAPTNRTPWVASQKRESVDRGGLYYHFEIFGLIMILQAYDVETGLPEDRSDWPFYMEVLDENDTFGPDGMPFLARHISRVLSMAGIENDIEPD